MTPERWQQIESLYHLVLKQGLSRRKAYLQETCAGDAELRREVESLLVQGAEAENFIERPAVEVAAKGMADNQTESFVGKHISCYKVLSLLGMGGMGKVYLAEDPRLERTVALKILPNELASDPERMRRFVREAKAASALKHSNVATIYEIGESEGARFIAMEYVEGQTLAIRIGGRSLETSEILDIGIQVADALDEADGKNIAHRDIKPANIMLTTRGQVKVLDFGLAKITQHEVKAAASDLGTAVSTETGVVMGTVQYMSPEQVLGRDVDHRTDIFSLGVILYEMATGRLPFVGTSSSETTDRILHGQPDAIARFNYSVPAELERIVRKCLEKDRERRYQSARDLLIDLKNLKRDMNSDAPTVERVPAQTVSELPSMLPESAPKGLKRRERLAWIALAVTLLGTMTLAVAHFRHVPMDVHPIRFVIAPPENVSFLSTPGISPDGRFLCYGASASGKTSLWVRPLDDLIARALPGTEDAAHPFWSPDSKFVAFFTKGKLKKTAVSGGPIETLCDALDGRGGTWNQFDEILFTPKPSDALYRVPASGGTAMPVTTLNRPREFSHRWPQFLPDGRRFVYFRVGPASGIYVGSLDSKDGRRLLEVDSSVRYAQPGYLLFVRDGVLIAQPFDFHRAQLTGKAFPIAEQVSYNSVIHLGYFSTSANQVLAYWKGGNVNTTQLAWFDRNGKELGSLGSAGEYAYPSLSPDDKTLAVQRLGQDLGTTDLWMIEVSGGVYSRFTFDPSVESCPLWSPDGSRVVFLSDREGSFDLYQKPSSGTGKEALLLKSSEGKSLTDWSQDGKFIIYSSAGVKGDSDLWVLPLFGDGNATPLLHTESDESNGRFSPDVHWVAYVSNETGKNQVYVQSFPASGGGKWQVSTGGGTQPSWRRDGKELFYLAPDRNLMAVAVKAEGKFDLPKVLFETHLDTNLYDSSNHYAVTADGSRFLVNMPVGEHRLALITVVLNWTGEGTR
jgi:eukaryotic-like serine/threonine-protein kinase